MKLKLFQNYLKKTEIDLAFLISPDSNLTYFIQMKPSPAFFLIYPKKASLYLTKLDSSPNLKNITLYQLNKNWEQTFKDDKIKKIGVNEGNLTLAYHQKLKKLYPKAKFVDISDKLKELRSCKTEEEIKRITLACKITTNAFNKLVNEYSSKKFKTELDIALFLEQEMREKGAELAFPTIVASNKNSSTPHHLTSTAKLRRGFLQLDFGSCYQNYCSDMSRVLVLGTISPEQKERYLFLLQTQQKTINQINLGQKCGLIDKFTRQELGKYSSNFIHSLGHGVGIDIHESPSLSPESEALICNNQIFTIEPGVYFPQKFGLRIEDTLLFNQKAKILTKASKDLISLK